MVVLAFGSIVLLVAPVSEFVMFEDDAFILIRNWGCVLECLNEVDGTRWVDEKGCSWFEVDDQVV